MHCPSTHPPAAYWSSSKVPISLKFQITELQSWISKLTEYLSRTKFCPFVSLTRWSNLRSIWTDSKKFQIRLRIKVEASSKQSNWNWSLVDDFCEEIFNPKFNTHHQKHRSTAKVHLNCLEPKCRSKLSPPEMEFLQQSVAVPTVLLQFDQIRTSKLSWKLNKQTEHSRIEVKRSKKLWKVQVFNV